MLGATIRKIDQCWVVALAFILNVGLFHGLKVLGSPELFV